MVDPVMTDKGTYIYMYILMVIYIYIYTSSHDICIRKDPQESTNVQIYNKCTYLIPTGHTYERKAVEAHIKEYGTDP